MGQIANMEYIVVSTVSCAVGSIVGQIANMEYDVVSTVSGAVWSIVGTDCQY